MTKTPIYETIISIAPSGNENRVAFELKLSPDDTIQANGRAKRVRDCTLGELTVFANSLEADVAALLDRTIGDLVNDPTIDVLGQDVDDLRWLDHLVIFDPLPEPKMEVDAAVEQEIMIVGDVDVIRFGVPSAPVVKVEIVFESDSPPADESEISIVDEDASMKDADEDESAVEGKDDKKEIEGLPEIEGAAEIIVVEEIDPSSVSVANSEPVHKDREAKEPFDVDKFKLNRPSRTAGMVTDRWLDNTVDVMIDEDPLRRMQAHASSSLRREVAGVMLGPLPEKQPNTNRYIVHVQDMIIAKHTKMRGASVTYTPESWRYLNDVIAERYPEEEMLMVGWYHTHPGFGIFLSGMDLFIHKNFFTQKWHVAYVLDPIARKSGFFSWDSDIKQVKPFPFIWPEWAAGSW